MSSTKDRGPYVRLTPNGSPSAATSGARSTSPNLARWLIVVLLTLLPLPMVSVRIAVIGLGLLFVIFSSVSAHYSVGQFVLPTYVTPLLAFSVMSIFWSVSSRDSVVAVGELIALFLIACYCASRMTLAMVHSSVALGLRFFLLANLCIVLLERLGYSLLPVASQTMASPPSGITANPNLLAFGSVISVISIGTIPSPTLKLKLYKTIWLSLGIIFVITSKSDGGLIYLIGALALSVLLRIYYTRGAFAPLAFALSITPLLLLSLDPVQRFVLGLLGVTQNETLSGRTVVWEVSTEALSMAPFTGYGFGSLVDPAYAPTSAMATVWHNFNFSSFSAHNGFLDIGLQLGFPGAILAALVVFSGLARFMRKPGSPSVLWGSLALLTLAIYNLTEARIMSPTQAWFFLILVVSSGANLVQQNGRETGACGD